MDEPPDISVLEDYVQEKLRAKAMNMAVPLNLLNIPARYEVHVDPIDPPRRYKVQVALSNPEDCPFMRRMWEVFRSVNSDGGLVWLENKNESHLKNCNPF